MRSNKMAMQRMNAAKKPSRHADKAQDIELMKKMMVKKGMKGGKCK